MLEEYSPQRSPACAHFRTRRGADGRAREAQSRPGHGRRASERLKAGPRSDANTAPVVARVAGHHHDGLFRSRLGGAVRAFKGGALRISGQNRSILPRLGAWSRKAIAQTRPDEAQTDRNAGLIGSSPIFQNLIRNGRPAVGQRHPGTDHRRDRHRQGADCTRPCTTIPREPTDHSLPSTPRPFPKTCLNRSCSVTKKKGRYRSQ